MPAAVWLQTIGSTIRNDINDGRTDDGIHSHATIISAATGTVLTSRITGEENVLKMKNLSDKKPKSIPRSAPKTNPSRICQSEVPTVLQKAAVIHSAENSFKVSSGSGILRISFLLITDAAKCQNPP